MNKRVYSALRKQADGMPQYEKDSIARRKELFGDLDVGHEYFLATGNRGKSLLRTVGGKAIKYRDEGAHSDAAAAFELLDSLAADLKKEHDTAGLNLGSAGSYAASMLGLGALGRLIAGKKHAGWGWGGGILVGALANYLRRKSYYGDIMV